MQTSKLIVKLSLDNQPFQESPPPGSYHQGRMQEGGAGGGVEGGGEGGGGPDNKAESIVLY